MMFLRLCLMALCCLGLQRSAFAEISPRLYAVEVSAQATSSPARIVLTWPADASATGYTVDRKLPSAQTWTRVGTLAGTATSFSDSAVTVGARFEYQIIKTVPYQTSGVGYILAGIDAPAVENRGKVILLVDSTHASALTSELRRLENDLVGDGWTVLRRDVSRAMTPPQVKAIIAADYNADPQNVRSVFIFGHVAVPYSGDIYPDRHPDHKGAWPTDAYYADINGVWTDTTVNTTTAEKLWNRNVPGDGKFDQDNIPSATELEVGRVDLYNMTCFANKTPARSELDLLRQYLNKDHNYRHAKFSLRRRGLVCDNFGESGGEAFAANGWRNFAPFFGAANNDLAPYGTFFPTLASQEYLFSYGTGGGGYYTCNGVGSSDDFAVNDIKTVFSFVFGSYFGDWDNESNFLRAPLGSTSHTLVSGWAGRPHWFMHPMGLGETIGATARLTQNNRTGGMYRPNMFAGGSHVSLMGDPTLRLHTIVPPKNFTVTAAATGNALAWQLSTDTNLAGYYVYRAASAAGPFARISGANPVTSGAFADATGTANHTYMVRAIKLEREASGSYFNLSQGIFAGGGAVVAPVALPPAAPSNLAAATPSATAAALTWRDNSTNETGFLVFRRAGNEASFTQRASVAASVTNYTDTIVAGTTYIYRVRASNVSGNSAFSNDATVLTAAAPTPAPIIATAAFVGRDLSTMGSWKGAYGQEGYRIIEDQFAYPTNVTVSASGQSPWIWAWGTADASALQRVTENSRLAACWYSFAPFEVQTLFTDDSTHRVSLYFLDWDGSNRSQTVQVLNADNLAVLGTETISNFADGVYLTWDVKGRVKFRITPITGNAVLSGVFFDSALPRAQAPGFTPASGSYLDSVTVSVAAETGTEVRYTVDGSDPTITSTLYTEPFALTGSANVKARAFKAGFRESLIASASYQVLPSGTPAASVEFLGLDRATGGTWKGIYGTAGRQIVADGSAMPAGVTASVLGAAQWIWAYSSTATRAIQRATVNDRMAPCWYSATSFDVDVNVSGDASRAVSLYFLDWDFGNRAQTVEVIDAVTGHVLHTSSVSEFSSGAYARYRIKGRVVVRVRSITANNAVMTGVFIDP